MGEDSVDVKTDSPNTFGLVLAFVVGFVAGFGACFFLMGWLVA
jgi:hypothetical protein